MRIGDLSTMPRLSCDHFPHSHMTLGLREEFSRDKMQRLERPPDSRENRREEGRACTAQR